MRQFVEIDASPLAYLDEGQGPAILFGHAYLMDAEAWRPQLEALKGRYRCIVPELWGHGQSGGLPATNGNLTDVASQMLQLMDSLGIAEFVLVGQGLGGIWGIELAKLVPTRVRALVLQGCFAGWEPQISRARYQGWLDEIAAKGAVPSAIAAGFTERYLANHPHPLLQQAMMARLAQWPADKIDALVRLGQHWIGREDRTDWLQYFSQPSLVIMGCEEKIHPVLEGYLMAEELGCPLKEIPGAGHLASLEASAAVTGALEAFLTTL
ncbi:alpha/beta fold hydrolase [Aeromonas sp. BIGb0445]|jgi:pimeloyl-ACP methyl ester carboxylesterase|uniref:alpha/beta fold hydrolase n=1 Tax=Aeromonas sp. BIGb0445 TaxID=2940593 RepID=UPI00216A1618|nr:alpha/beta hydrolase [Aeromonas sp. BIGb0445]MCS3458553.1 pimeloyl-ACP methyl ester carboxylesterase [Aeromonas sp. BIGb0445]